MPKIILKGFITVPEADLRDVQNELAKHIKLTQQEEGCLVFEVSQDKDNKNKFIVYEEFSSDEAFRAHQERVAQSKWGMVSANVERHYTVAVEPLLKSS